MYSGIVQIQVTSHLLHQRFSETPVSGIKENMQEGETIWKFSFLSQADKQSRLPKLILHARKQAASHTIII